MSGKGIVLVAAMLGGCATRPAEAPRGPQLPEASDATVQEVRAQVESTMGAFASMNLERFKAGLAADVAAFEMDMDNKPVRLGSRAEALRFAEATFGQLKKMGASAKVDIHSTSCRASSTLAYCTVEFDFKATMPDGSAMAQATRNSVALRKDNDGWKWTHWHSSLAVAPGPQAPAPTK